MAEYHEPQRNDQTDTDVQVLEPQTLPPWKVLLHNDDTSEMGDVVTTIVELTPLNAQDAMDRMMEAHNTGVALVLVTHKERAELYQEQFTSKGLCVTIEPDDV